MTVARTYWRTTGYLAASMAATIVTAAARGWRW